jgi:hypothetical protein
MLQIPTDIFSASVKKRHNKPLQTNERRVWFWADCEAIRAPLAAERQAVGRKKTGGNSHDQTGNLQRLAVLHRAGRRNIAFVLS